MGLTAEIQKVYPDFKLDISFTAATSSHGILGASGSGKSMTLRCIAGLETPTGGRIVLNDRVLFDSEKGINLPSRKRNIGFLFQNYALFPHLTVLQNIAFGLNGLPKKEIARRAEEKISMVKLEGLEQRYPSQLSGGQQQRVALARALVMEPAALLLDEPFSALDSHLRSQMEKQLIETLADYKGVAIFVSHQLGEVYRVCRDLLLLDKGNKIACGSKEEIFQRPSTYTAARLTGCKNISRARALSPGVIEAHDWGCKLRVTKAVPCDLTHVGIRSHQLAFVDDAGIDNTFPCWVAGTSETPDRVTLFLSLNTPSSHPGHYQLQAEVFGSQWAKLKEREFPWHVHLEPGRLFFTNGL